jgi:HSP20 family protein
MQDNNWLSLIFGIFIRSFALDDAVDAGKAAAKYEDGMLKLTLPKKEGSQKVSRTIKVQ